MVNAASSLPVPGLPDRLAGIIEAMRRAAAARAGRYPYLAPLVMVVWNYLGRVSVRFARLAERVGRGDACRPRTRPGPRPRPPPDASPCDTTRPRKVALPRAEYWLIWLVPDAGSLGSQLRHLLAEPDMVALLEADPRSGRILRPLCRALGIRPGPDVPAALFPSRTTPITSPVPPPAAPPARWPATAYLPDRDVWPDGETDRAAPTSGFSKAG